MKKGFTLIELLIVVAIIGVLASIVVVSLSTSTDDAKKNKALFNVAQAARTLVLQQQTGDADAYNCTRVGGETTIPTDLPAATATAANHPDVGTLYCTVINTVDTSNSSTEDDVKRFVVFEKYGTAAADFLCASNVETNPEEVTLTNDLVTDYKCST